MSAYMYVRNIGYGGKDLFIDDEDYQVFLNYLKEYLSPQSDPSTFKKSFTVSGKTFSGVPHLPKNYYKKVELISYALTSKGFDIVLKQSEARGIESFVRSICTRYSIYYNKRYQSKGSVFDGPYKSTELEGAEQVTITTYKLHKLNGHTSNDKYVNGDLPSWIKPEIDSDIYNKAVNTPEKIENNQKVPVQSTKKYLKAHQRVHHLLYATAIFFVLFSIGLRNIFKETNTSTVLSESIEAETYEAEIVMRDKNKLQEINIYEKQDINSTVIGKAKNGDIYEFTSINTDWYQIILPDGSFGFITYLNAEIHQNE